jgi:hypothetical protein
MRRIVCAAVALSISSLGHAQGVIDSVRTPRGYCRWQVPPIAAGYPRCALDRPAVLGDAPPLPTPRVHLAVAGSVVVVVNPDGRVNDSLTSPHTLSADEEFNRVALETIRRWRFTPGYRQGRPVRSWFVLELMSASAGTGTPFRRGSRGDT